MLIKQLSIFAENRPGAVAEALGVLAKANMQLRAFTIADTADFGVIRALVDDADAAAAALRAEGYAVNVAEVSRVEFPDEPGALYETLRKLGGVNVEYAYGFEGADGAAYGVIKTSAPRETERILG